MRFSGTIGDRVFYQPRIGSCCARCNNYSENHVLTCFKYKLSLASQWTASRENHKFATVYKCQTLYEQIAHQNGTKTYGIRGLKFMCRAHLTPLTHSSVQHKALKRQCVAQPALFTASPKLTVFNYFIELQVSGALLCWPKYEWILILWIYDAVGYRARCKALFTAWLFRNINPGLVHSTFRQLSFMVAWRYRIADRTPS